MANKSHLSKAPALKKEAKRITVLGAGGWGTCLTVLLANQGYRVTLWGHSPEHMSQIVRAGQNKRFLPGIPIPESVRLTSQLSHAWDNPDVVVLAVPSQNLRQVLEQAADFDWENRLIVSASKGIEEKTLLRMSGVIRSVAPTSRIVALSGPSISYEVARGVPTTVVAASSSIRFAQQVQAIFSGERFRVYTSTDMIGVELGGSLKNVIAIACGIADGLKFGTNTKAALVTRGIVEIARLGIAMGAKRDTFSGLSGLGDLVTTCFSPYSRNRGVGEKLGKGIPLPKITKKMEQVAEGVPTTKSAFQLSEQYQVDMPITSAVYRVLCERESPVEMVRELMLREPKPE